MIDRLVEWVVIRDGYPEEGPVAGDKRPWPGFSDAERAYLPPTCWCSETLWTDHDGAEFHDDGSNCCVSAEMGQLRREKAELLSDLRTEMERIREHAEEIWGSDWHERHQLVFCPRCTLDMMLYGEAVFNIETREHYDVRTIARRVPS